MFDLETYVAALNNTMNCDSTEVSEEEDSSHAYSSGSGCHLTNSFDRFPFMSRPLHSTLGNRPVSSLIYSGGEEGVKQSVSNPNVLFCTPDDMKRVGLIRYEPYNN